MILTIAFAACGVGYSLRTSLSLRTYYNRLYNILSVKLVIQYFHLLLSSYVIPGGQAASERYLQMLSSPTPTSLALLRVIPAISRPSVHLKL